MDSPRKGFRQPSLQHARPDQHAADVSEARALDAPFAHWPCEVVFFGTLDGWFKAIDAHSGQELWKFKCGSGIVGQPVTYRGPDGKQYVAILSGVGGWAGAIVAGGLDGRDPTGALGFLGAMQDLPSATTKGGMLYVFSLP